MPKDVRKFDFDTVFDADGVILRSRGRGKESFTKAEVEEAREAGRTEGETSGTAAAQAAIAAALGQVSAALEGILARLDSESATLKNEAVDLGLTAARLLAEHALAANPEADAAAFFEDIVDDLRAEPRINVTVPPDTVDVLQSAIQARAADNAILDRVTVRAGPDQTPGDCVISWSSGAISRDTAAVLADIREKAIQWLSADADVSEPQFDLFDTSETAS